jgi:ribose 5-phosphate isomerase A
VRPDLLADPARAAVAHALAERLEPGMLLGLGSGRAVWALVQVLGERWAGRRPAAVVVGSSATEALATAAGFEVVELDGTVTVDVAVDGADQLDRGLALIKGHGGALLREKLVVGAARRFVVVAERAKLAERLGHGCLLPVEVVRFAWPDTRRRLLSLVPGASLRVGADLAPVVTDEGHHLLDCEVPLGVDLHELAAAIKGTLGVVEHGLFLDQADEAILGLPDGSVEVLSGHGDRGQR